MRFAPVTAEPPKPEQPTIWTYKGEPAPEAPDVRTRLSKDELRERQRQKKLERQRQKQEKAPRQKAGAAGADVLLTGGGIFLLL